MPPYAESRNSTTDSNPFAALPARAAALPRKKPMEHCQDMESTVPVLPATVYATYRGKLTRYNLGHTYKIWVAAVAQGPGQYSIQALENENRKPTGIMRLESLTYTTLYRDVDHLSEEWHQWRNEQGDALPDQWLALQP